MGRVRLDEAVARGRHFGRVVEVDGTVGGAGEDLLVTISASAVSEEFLKGAPEKTYVLAETGAVGYAVDRA